MITAIGTISIVWTAYELGRLAGRPATTGRVAARDVAGRVVKIDVVTDRERRRPRSADRRSR